jgi:hypothetical protein
MEAEKKLQQRENVLRDAALEALKEFGSAEYARGWNDRLNFGLPMNLARVKPPEERSN